LENFFRFCDSKSSLPATRTFAPGYYNLHHFDSWAATFGEPVTAMELSPDGAGCRLQTRFARFINVPELMQMFRQSAAVQVQTAAMLNPPPQSSRAKSLPFAIRPPPLS
jgi:hypothetical protein